MFLWTVSSGLHRHPVARILAWLVGLLIFAALLTFGAVVFLGLVIGSVVLMLVNMLRTPRAASVTTANSSPPTSPPPGVIEGEFTVVDDQARKS